MEKTTVHLRFGGREWENYITSTRAFQGLWMMILDCIGIADSNPELHYENGAIRGLLTMPFAAIFSACGKRLPLISLTDIERVTAKYQKARENLGEFQFLRREVYEKLKLISPFLEVSFVNAMEDAKIGDQQKADVCMCVLVLVDRLLNAGTLLKSDEDISEGDPQELGFESLVDDTEKPKDSSLELQEPGQDGPGGQKRERRSIEAKIPVTTFADIAGYADVITQLKQVAQMTLQAETYRSCGCDPVRGLLLKGPPGCGKTEMTEALAHEIGRPFYPINIAQISSHYINLTSQYVQQMFDALRKKGGGILFLDEADSIIFSRKKTIHEEDQKLLGVLNLNMQPRNPPDGILVVLATNVPESLDEAALREGRIDQIIEVSLPDKSSRDAILRHYALRAQKIAGQSLFEKMSKSVWNEVLQSTEGFSGAGLRLLMNNVLIKMANAKIRGEVVPLRTTYNILAEVETLIQQRKHTGAKRKYGFPTQMGNKSVLAKVSVVA